jgi:hypothetical protein
MQAQHCGTNKATAEHITSKLQHLQHSRQTACDSRQKI